MNFKKISLKFLIYGVLISATIFNLLIGLNIVEQKTRMVGFENSNQMVFINEENKEYILNINLLGKEYNVNIKNEFEFINDISNKTCKIINYLS